MDMKKMTELVAVTQELEEKTRRLEIFFEEVQQKQSVVKNETYLKLTLKNEPICSTNESFEVVVTAYQMDDAFNIPIVVNKSQAFCCIRNLKDMWMEVTAQGMIDGEAHSIRLGCMQVASVTMLSDLHGYIIATR